MFHLIDPASVGAESYTWYIITTHLRRQLPPKEQYWLPALYRVDARYSAGSLSITKERCPTSSLPPLLFGYYVLTTFAHHIDSLELTQFVVIRRSPPLRFYSRLAQCQTPLYCQARFSIQSLGVVHGELLSVILLNYL